MPACGNCGAHVTPRYLRVFAPHENGVDGCPVCDAYPNTSFE